MKREQVQDLLNKWRENIVPEAGTFVSDLFKSADKVMLEYADKAETNQIQNRFFEGQREIWLKQDQVESQFHDGLYHDLFDFMRNPEQQSRLGSETLSLVSKDTFERSLALQTISDQAIKHNSELYHALGQRLGVFVGRPAIDVKLIPAGPHQLSSVFEKASNVLNVEREVLLALFTLFERDVIRRSSHWHENLNEDLRSAGILPNLKYKIVRAPGAVSDKSDEAEDEYDEQAQAAGQPGQRQGGGAPARAGGAHAGAGAARESQGPATGAPYHEPGGSSEEEIELGDQILSRVRELLAAQRTRQALQRGATVRPEPLHPAPSEAVARAVETAVATTDTPLPETGVREKGAKQAPVSTSLLQKIRNALSIQRTQVKETVGRNKLSHFDEDIIDIVGMLFEVMLNDKRLGNTVKALLSHLHTPYLKVAIRDRTFLEHREYPARRLFDEMIEAGSRWVDERDLTQGLYPQLQFTVERIVRAKEHPVQLFQELEDKLTTEIKALSEKQKVREARTIETEKGKARLEEAKLTAAKVTKELLAVEGAPARYTTFVTGPWTDYLTLIYLRSGGDTDSGTWRGAQVLSNRILALVKTLVSGQRPLHAEVVTLRDEFNRRLEKLIPQYQSEVNRLFEIFA